jgi:hypothetical protein
MAPTTMCLGGALLVQKEGSGLARRAKPLLWKFRWPLCANSGHKRARSANLKITSRSLTIHQCFAVSFPAVGSRVNVP